MNQNSWIYFRWSLYLLLWAKIPWKKWIASIVNKSLKFSTWVQSQKWQNNLIHFQGKPFNIRVTQIYARTTNAKEDEAQQFCEDLQDILELTLKNK